MLKIYGVCTAPGEYPIIVLPFMKHGDLRTFLERILLTLEIQSTSPAGLLKVFRTKCVTIENWRYFETPGP